MYVHVVFLLVRVVVILTHCTPHRVAHLLEVQGMETSIEFFLYLKVMARILVSS